MQLRFRRASGHAQHLGNLFVFVPFHIVQHEYLSCSWRKPRDGRVEIERQPRRPPARSCVRQGIHLVGLGAEARAVPSLALASIEHDVDRQPVQPGRESTLTGTHVQDRLRFLQEER